MQLGLHRNNEPKVATDLARDYAMATKRRTDNAEPTELSEFKLRGER